MPSTVEEIAEQEPSRAEQGSTVTKAALAPRTRPDHFC
jgi:hypothetical protein